MINLGRLFVTGGGMEKSLDNSLGREDRGALSVSCGFQSKRLPSVFPVVMSEHNRRITQ